MNKLLLFYSNHMKLRSLGLQICIPSISSSLWCSFLLVFFFYHFVLPLPPFPFWRTCDNCVSLIQQRQKILLKDESKGKARTGGWGVRAAQSGAAIKHGSISSHSCSKSWGGDFVQRGPYHMRGLSHTHRHTHGWRSHAGEHFVYHRRWRRAAIVVEYSIYFQRCKSVGGRVIEWQETVNEVGISGTFPLLTLVRTSAIVW